MIFVVECAGIAPTQRVNFGLTRYIYVLKGTYMQTLVYFYIP